MSGETGIESKIYCSFDYLVGDDNGGRGAIAVGDSSHSHSHSIRVVAVVLREPLE